MGDKQTPPAGRDESLRSPAARNAVFYVDAAEIETARRVAYAWGNQSFGAGAGGSLESQLSTPLSANGEFPATAFLCSFPCTPDVLRSAEEFIADNRSAIQVFEMETAAFLESQQLTIITGW